MSERSKVYLGIVTDYDDKILEVWSTKTKRGAQRRAVDSMLAYTDLNPSQLYYAYVYDWNEEVFIYSAVMIEYNGLVETAVRDLNQITITESGVIDKFLLDRMCK